MIKRFAAAGCLLVPMAILAYPAGAQDALGSGHALDGNLDPRSGGIVPNSPVENLQLRNLLITDNIVGGRGFRESVGYTAENSFRGEMGSNDLYSFRRDSAWSDVNYLNYGETFKRLRYGQAIGLIEYDRVGDGATVATIDQAFMRPRERIEAKLRVDRFTAASSLYSVAEFAVEPSMIGAFLDEEGRHQLMHASSLTGVGSTAYDQMGQLIGLSSFDSASFRDDIFQGRAADDIVGQRFEPRYSDLMIRDGQRVVTPRDERVETSLIAGADTADETAPDDERQGFERIRERIAQRFSQLPPGVSIDAEKLDLETLDKEMTDLRAWLQSVAIERPLPGQPADPNDPMRRPGGEIAVIDSPRTPLEFLESAGLGAKPTEIEGDGEADGETTTTTERGTAAGTGPVPIKDFGLILRHGQRIDELASKDQTRFNELIAAGESLLREGEYFWAERRFIRALRFTPGHPLATAGLAHAQIGAGLYLSAALTLHSLFVYQPEMIDTRFGPGLIPNRPRLFTAATVLSNRLESSPDRGSVGFLYAYIGRLLEDRAIVEEGLDVMHDATPDDPLVPLLREIWLRTDDAQDGSKPEEPGAPE